VFKDYLSRAFFVFAGVFIDIAFSLVWSMDHMVVARASAMAQSHLVERPFRTEASFEETRIQDMTNQARQRHEISKGHVFTYVLDNSQEMPVLRVHYNGKDTGYYIERASVSSPYKLMETAKKNVYEFKFFNGIQYVLVQYLVSNYKELIVKVHDNEKIGNYTIKSEGDSAKFLLKGKDTGYKLEFRYSPVQRGREISHGLALLNPKNEEIARYDFNLQRYADDIRNKIGARR